MWLICKVGGKDEIIEFGNNTLKCEEDLESVRKVLVALSGNPDSIILLRFLGIIKKNDQGGGFFKCPTPRLIPFIWCETVYFNAKTVFSLGYSEEEALLICNKIKPYKEEDFTETVVKVHTDTVSQVSTM